MIYPTKLVFSFEDISYKEKVIKSILERLKRIDQSQRFIGSLKIENKTIDYKPFVTYLYRLLFHQGKIVHLCSGS